jgi:hypothetical protein
LSVGGQTAAFHDKHDLGSYGIADGISVKYHVCKGRIL